MDDSQFHKIFSDLKELLVPYKQYMECTEDNTNSFYLNTRHIMSNGKPLFFAAVAIKKKYVSFQLMPVYVEPALLECISEQLKKRMQGKSCFNFKREDEALFSELKALLESGFEFYQQQKYI